MVPERPPEFIREVRIVRTNLPHIEEPGATYHVTMCLDRPANIQLAESPLAEMLTAAVRHYDDRKHHLFDYTIMPDHLHMILKPMETPAGWYCLARLLYDLKQFTARRINAAMKREGHVWQRESHDHIIRNREDYEEKANYIFCNPHTKGLVDDPADWPWWGRGSGVYL